MSRYYIETCIYIVIVQWLSMINSQPPPLLTNFFCGCCACGFGYIFRRCIVIIINAKAYRPNTGNIFIIPMSILKVDILSPGFKGSFGMPCITTSSNTTFVGSWLKSWAILTSWTTETHLLTQWSVSLGKFSWVKITH